MSHLSIVPSPDITEHPAAVSLKAIASSLRAIAEACDALREGAHYPARMPSGQDAGQSCAIPDDAVEFNLRWLRHIKEDHGDARWRCGGCRQWQEPGAEVAVWLNTNLAGPSPLCACCAEHATPDPIEYEEAPE